MHFRTFLQVLDDLNNGYYERTMVEQQADKSDAATPADAATSVSPVRVFVPCAACLQGRC